MMGELEIVKHLGHVMVRDKSGFYCEKCHFHWKSQPKTSCPTLPRYRNMRETPEIFQPASEMRRTYRMKPAPDQKPVAVRRGLGRGHQWTLLYDIRECVPIRRRKKRT